MKYIVVLGDGMSDYPIPELGNKTPLQAARKPGMDFIADHGVVGLARTIPDGVSAASDTANMSVLGFNPAAYYTGRSPIEAVSMGISLKDEDIAYRCNLVTLSGEEAYEDKIMLDYSSDEITSAEAAELIKTVNGRFLGELSEIPGNEKAKNIKFYPGISYRHCMVWRGAGAGAGCTPPHDILTRGIGKYLPVDADGSGDARILNLLMRESYECLATHEVNLDRIKRGINPANSLWLWGQGKRLSLPSFSRKYGITGAVVAAVDLIKGIGISAGLRSIDVDGATGTLNTNYRGKADAALAALKDGCDFVYVHVEAPDECGHRYEIDNKVKSIEYIDEHIVSVMLDELERRGEDFSILVLPDHPTPLSTRTHADDPVPFALYTSSERRKKTTGYKYDESDAARSGVYIDQGHTLMDKFLGNEFGGITQC